MDDVEKERLAKIAELEKRLREWEEKKSKEEEEIQKCEEIKNTFTEYKDNTETTCTSTSENVECDIQSAVTTAIENYKAMYNNCNTFYIEEIGDRASSSKKLLNEYIEKASTEINNYCTNIINREEKLKKEHEINKDNCQSQIDKINAAIGKLGG